MLYNELTFFSGSSISSMQKGSTPMYCVIPGENNENVEGKKSVVMECNCFVISQNSSVMVRGEC